MCVCVCACVCVRVCVCVYGIGIINMYSCLCIPDVHDDLNGDVNHLGKGVPVTFTI